MIGRIGLALLALLVAAPAALAACRDDVVELRGDWGTARFRVELAQTPAERAQGLMNREEMAPGAGMLFIYPRPQPSIGFWMRNTLIPLDILFFDAAGVLKRRHIMAEPLDETMLPGGPGIQYVLEVNGGIARDMGIGEGSELRHPAIDQAGAAWPC